MDASLQARAEELAKEIAGEARTAEDLNGLMRLMMKSALERMLPRTPRSIRGRLIAELRAALLRLLPTLPEAERGAVQQKLSRLPG